MTREVPGWFRLLLCWPALLVLGMGLLALLTAAADPSVLTRPETLIPGSCSSSSASRPCGP